MTVVVRMDKEHFEALRRARAAMRGEQMLLRRWDSHSVELTLAIDTISELIERYLEATAQHPDPWSRKVTT